MGTIEVSEAMTAMIIITLPLLLGLILDWNSHVFHIKKEAVIFINRACLGIAFLVLSILGNRRATQTENVYSSTFYPCMITAMKNIIATTLMGCVSASSDATTSVWKPWKTTWIATLTVASHLSRMFYIFHPNVPEFFTACLVLFIVDALSLLAFVVEWVWRSRDLWLPARLLAWCHTDSTVTLSRLSPDIFSPDNISSVLYFVAFVVGLFGSPIILTSQTNPKGERHRGCTVDALLRHC
jgi:hypothetical protein